MNILKMDKELQGRLWSHLLREDTVQEQAAFLFCMTEPAGNGSTFEAVDQALLGPDDFVAQHRDYFELTDEARISLIKRAHVLGASLAELHSHPGPWPACLFPVRPDGIEGDRAAYAMAAEETALFGLGGGALRLRRFGLVA